MKFLILIVIVPFSFSYADSFVKVNVDQMQCVGEGSAFKWGEKGVEAIEQAEKNYKFVDVRIDNVGEKTNGSIQFRSDILGQPIKFKNLSPSKDTIIGTEGRAPISQYEAAGGDGFRVNLYENSEGDLTKILEKREGFGKVLHLKGAIDMWQLGEKKYEYGQMGYSLSCRVKFSESKVVVEKK